MEHAEPHGPAVQPHALSWPTIALTSVAGTKSLLVLLLVTPLAPHIADPGRVALQTSLHALPWFFPGVLLLLANSRQCRTGSLGVAMILVSSLSTTAAIELLARSAPIMGLLRYPAPAVLAPYYFGKFLLEFPQPRTGRSARWLSAATRLAGIVGVMQLVAILNRRLLQLPALPVVSRVFDSAAEPFVGVVTTFLLCVVVLGLSFVGFRGLLHDDRRRHTRLLPSWSLVIASLTLGVVINVVSQLVGHYRWMNLVTGLSSLTMIVAPSIIAYRVFSGHLGQLRDALRRGALIMLNARVLAIAALGPLVAVGVVAYLERHDAVADVFTRTTILWIGVAAVSALAWTRRRTLLRAFNRWFFREDDHTDQALLAFSSQIRQATSIDELVSRVVAGIERVMRPYRVVVMVRDESATAFVPMSGSAEPLPSSALLADLLRAGRGVLDTPLAGGASPMRWLPQDERYWLVDCGARLVVPLHGSDGSLTGLIVVGDRRSGQPYTDSDRQWLTTVAESATLTIEAHSPRTTHASGPGTSVDRWRVGLVQRHARALECESCGQIVEAGAAACPGCGKPLIASLVPHVLHVLHGKFRFEQRIGRGGMGVVFRATDLALDRPVAVKMLPGASPEYSELLRHEARAMAAVTHRHLAVVYGVEAWRGQPLLVCEYMPHGTLADRLSHRAMPADDALALGVSLAEALEVIHARQLLHRDIKPSNIGFDHAHVPKLLDFGLAHLPASPAGDAQLTTRTSGTPLYMSPESIAGLPPTPAVDLWGLHVMLHEAMTGAHPFRRATTEATFNAISRDATPTIAPPKGLSPDRAVRLAAYFARALSKSPNERPSSAAETASQLRALMA